MTQATAVSVVALKTFPLFHGLSDDSLASIARVSMMRRFPRGQSVVCAGDRPDYVYLVLTGSLKVVVSDEDGREVILSILGQGELFGEMGMFDERPRSASVIAVVPADLVLISKQDFRRIMQDSFDVSWRIMCNLAERLRNADRKIESLALMDVLRPGRAPADRDGGGRRRPVGRGPAHLQAGYRQDDRRLARDGEPGHEGPRPAGPDRGRPRRNPVARAPQRRVNPRSPASRL